jgi:hypothetical protein
LVVSEKKVSAVVPLFIDRDKGQKISEDDWVQAAGIISCEIEVIKAFAHVETKLAPFDQFLRPVIQYERHKFARHTHHRFDATNADISGKAYTSAKFTKDGSPIAATDRYVSDAYARFERAYLLDADAAIQACSWGMFQVLGENYSDMQIDSPEKFMQMACTSDREHVLGLFVPFANGQARSQIWSRHTEKCPDTEKLGKCSVAVQRPGLSKK